MKRYAFFLRHFNDIDNITPAIYYLMKSDDRINCDVLVYSADYDIRNDINLNFLKTKFSERIKIRWIGDLIGINRNRYFDNKLYKYVYTQYGRIATHKSINHLKSGRRVDFDHTVRLLKDLITSPKIPEAVIFDQNRSQTVSSLVKAVRYLGVKRVISLPVSPFSNVNTLRSDDMVILDSNLLQKKHDYSIFDKVGVVDGFYLESLKNTYQLFDLPSPLKNKGVPLGSIRYSPEWLQIRKEEYFMEENLSVSENKNLKTKIVFFLSNPRTNVFWDEVLRSISFMSQFSDYEITVKPHPRSELKSLPNYDNVILDSKSQSSELIDRSDIILYWGSSIALEGLIKNKFMACLDYVNGNHSVYRMFEPGYMMNCRDDLHSLMELYNKDKDKLHYNEAGVQELIKNVVFINKDSEISNRYLEFITKTP